MMRICRIVYMSAVEVSGPLLLGSSISVRLEHIGAEHQPLMIVDEVLADPQAMIDAARRGEVLRSASHELSGHQCSGAPVLLFDGDHGTARPHRSRTSEYRARSIFRTSASLHWQRSVPPTRSRFRRFLTAIRPIPIGWRWFIGLCRGSFGGTGFFRHRGTGFESVDVSRQARYERGPARSR